MSSKTQYSKPVQTKELFVKGILQNPLISKDLPKEAAQCAAGICFEGSEEPTLPINWRLAESVSALKALEATMINVLLLRKYGIKPSRVTINTDHAQLFFMSTLLFDIDPRGKHLTTASNATQLGLQAFEQQFPSLNPDPTLRSLNLPLRKEFASLEEAYQPFIEAVGRKTAEEIDQLENGEWRQAGTICWTTEEYFESEHGRANSHVGLYEVETYKNAKQAPCWWPESQHTSPKRPLAGLKVIDLTRVIAAPAITRGLAELGASVMRITCPRLPDYSLLHPDLNWGKWNAFLDFKSEQDRERMKQLILEADIVVQGYRPGVLDKFGFSSDEILRLCESRERGIVIVRENCYGWHGPWAGRSGWQQISDACCGVSMEYGLAMGNNEPVTPVFPNSDYCTGISGVVGVLDGLLRRARDGGSYRIDVALNYYSQWLVRSCGTYPEDVWQDLWARNGKPVFHHHHTMSHTIPIVLKMMGQHHADILLRPEFFEERPCPSIGYTIKTVKPILQYADGEVELRYNVGTRTNGVDKPYWPEDLMTEFVR
ncbi:hypothetical protein ACJ41O_015007 [Fusarium nematophilum]